MESNIKQDFGSMTYQDKTPNKVTKKEINKMIWRSNLLQGSFNYERMQGGGWTYSLIPGLKKIHQNDQDLAIALSNHMQFFNTSPQLVTLVQGIIIAMEEGKEDPSVIQGIKVALMGPLGGIGDALFFLTLLPIAAGIGSSLALEGNVMGPFIFLLLYNIPYLAAKIGLMKLGYDMGVKAISLLSESTKKVSRAASIVGLAVVGALIAKSVRINVAYIIHAGEVELDLQTQLFDTIMPKLLPLLYTLGCFMILRKGKNPIVLIMLTVVFALAGAFFGIF
ncbi:PTS system mannose/fructose/sorbose family transporter subunit IID [Breznakia pachnodae]|uniref:PTS system N-acetylgalactosamine-specific IID component n=1 Tax=Breznakia pachnodae TaxID=265178 RepID=A0ABU0DZU5_9FIRM|nr:PTS system mannose/fructose/sorbose family transporter subunit IID [Breznakia pachnodae]MDQ0360159.1 PTS system N-acetylgalactosamine-specific IID component [Breznakia pachnodae]